MRYQTCSIDMLQASSVILLYALDLPLTETQLVAWPLGLLCNLQWMLIPETSTTPFSPCRFSPPCLAQMTHQL
jgi:hypothetical protein